MTAIEKTTANLMLSTFDQEAVMKHALLIQGRLYVTRDGLLHVAHRSGVFDGMEVVEQGETQTHFTAKVSVYHKDMGRPFTYIGRHPKSSRMAKDYGPEMAVKVAEVMAMRRAFDVAICAAEERWDEEAQQDQADNPAPAAAPQARRTDVTREVAQAAGVQPQTTEPDPMDVRMRHYGPKLAARREALRKYGVTGEAVSARLAELPDWRASDENAEAAMRNLEEWGAALKAGRGAAASASPQATSAPISEELATNAQIQQLQGAARSAGASTSEDRALLWAALLGLGAPIGTKELSEEQAALLLRRFEGMDLDARRQAMSEAKKEAKGRLL